MEKRGTRSEEGGGLQERRGEEERKTVKKRGIEGAGKIKKLDKEKKKKRQIMRRGGVGWGGNKERKNPKSQKSR